MKLSIGTGAKDIVAPRVDRPAGGPRVLRVLDALVVRPALRSAKKIIARWS